MTTYRVKRVYEDPGEDDGYRVLVDRLWPRGVSKERAQLDEWCKDVAPSDELRKWFHHEEQKFEEFERRYREELDANEQVPEVIARWEQHPVVTLLFATRERERNQAVVLAEYVSARRGGRGRAR